MSILSKNNKKHLIYTWRIFSVTANSIVDILFEYFTHFYTNLGKGRKNSVFKFSCFIKKSEEISLFFLNTHFNLVLNFTDRDKKQLNNFT